MTVAKQRLRTSSVLLVLAGLVSPASGDSLQIERHETASTVNLVPGALRGTIMQPLLTGTIASTGQQVLFVLTDASDQEFAEMFGAICADSLAQAADEAVEAAIFESGTWTFFEDPGRVARFDAGGNVLPPVTNPDYSPLKRIDWNGKTVTVNAPFVKWGDGPG